MKSARSAEWIERFSRQIVLAEVGPPGQIRLGESRVAVVGEGAAAARVVAYLAAAGVGWIAAAPALHGTVDPAQPGLTLVPLTAATGRLDAAIVAAASQAEAATDVALWSARAGATLWIAAGRVGGTPPCPACAATATGSTVASPDLARLSDTLLGTVAATEAVKTLLAIGTSLRSRVLVYDPETASITEAQTAARPDCACASPPPPE